MFVLDTATLNVLGAYHDSPAKFHLECENRRLFIAMNQEGPTLFGNRCCPGEQHTRLTLEAAKVG